MLAGKHCRFHIAQTFDQLIQILNALPEGPPPLKLDPEPTAVLNLSVPTVKGLLINPCSMSDSWSNVSS